MQSLTTLSPEQQQARGIQHTAHEIAQQPTMWRKMGEKLQNQLPDLKTWLTQAPAPFVLTGAGTSEYVARCVVPAWRHHGGLNAVAAPTTEIVIDPRGNIPAGPVTLVSFARSGNSPESVAAVDLVDTLDAGGRHLAITCNAQGELAEKLKQTSAHRVVLLPPETNDKGLAMTSSYSTLTVAGIGLALSSQQLASWIDGLAASGESLLQAEETSAQTVGALNFDRAVFIGGGAHYGTALEAHLKLQELTDGQVICKAEGTLGVRHGPMASIHDNTLIVMFLSGSAYAQQYELDLLREMRAKQLGCHTVVIGDGLHSIAELVELADTLIDVKLPAGSNIDDTLRAPLYVLWPQMLAVYTSLHRGLTPDTPSAAGVINRVVEGVRIHPWG